LPTGAFQVMHWIRSWLTFIGVSTSHPLAFVVVAVYVVLWLIFDPRSFGWQSAATVATWVMTLFIQRAEHRDTQAIHAKLDELLRVAGEADSDLATLDQQEPEEIAAPWIPGQRQDRVRPSVFTTAILPPAIPGVIQLTPRCLSNYARVLSPRAGGRAPPGGLGAAQRPSGGAECRPGGQPGDA